MKREKIGTSYFRSGYGRGIRKATVYLINGHAYAKDMSTSKTDFNPLIPYLFKPKTLKNYYYETDK